MVNEHHRGSSNSAWGVGEDFPEEVTSKLNLIRYICGPHFDKPHIGCLVGGKRVAGSGGIVKDQVLEELEWHD